MSDPLEEAMTEMRAQLAEQEAQRAEFERSRQELERQRREQVLALARSFIMKARAQGISPTTLQLAGYRDVRRGVFGQRVERKSITIQKSGWVVAPYVTRGFDASDTPGCYVLDDGTVLYALRENAVTSDSVESLTGLMAAFLLQPS